MNNTVELKQTVPVVGEYDIIVAGGGVAGVAAAVSAKRMGKNVLLIEKTISLGGLATNGLVNLFVPMCNGRGTQIIKGMAQEFFDLSIKYGFDTVPEDWNDKDSIGETTQRYVTRFSAPIFAMVLTKLIKNEGIEILFDTVISRPILENKKYIGVVVENKSGTEFYGCKMIIDTTGDADVLYRGGVPTVQGHNYHTYYSFGVDMKCCEEAIRSKNMSKLTKIYSGADADLYGRRHPEGKPLWKGTNVVDVTNYVVECHMSLLERIKEDEREKRDVLHIPNMPQFRTTRRIEGDYTLTVDDVYKHFDDSVGVICDFDKRDYLYEIPYRTMVKTGYPNIITAGRCVAGEGYVWDVLRVIPPAIITGQVAGTACSIAIDSDKDIYDIDVFELQKVLKLQDVMIHFDDKLINYSDTDINVDIGHI